MYIYFFPSEFFTITLSHATKGGGPNLPRPNLNAKSLIPPAGGKKLYIFFIKNDNNHKLG